MPAAKVAKVTKDPQRKAGPMWRLVDVDLHMTGRFAAALPRTPDEIMKMLENRMPTKAPKDYIPLDQLSQDVAAKVVGHAPGQVALADAPEAETGEEPDELKYGWATFPRNSEGFLHYEGRCVRGHIKDCATQVKDFLDIVALKSKVANKVYVLTDVIELGFKAADLKTEQRFVQVMTRQGPRSTIKFIDYLEKPTLKFQLQIFNDGVVTDEILDTIFQYGCVHGLGQERSTGYGRYTFTVTPLQPPTKSK